MQVIAQRGIIALCFALSGCIMSTQAKLQELQQLAASTPKFPDFEQVNYSDISKSDKTVVAYFYRSAASYDEVKSFYTNALLSQGWSSVQEEPLAKWSKEHSSQRLSFKKGKYTIQLEYDADKSSKWKFVINYGLS
jgi:hypothetical protein